MNGYFIRNLETGHTELHFGKADYLALSDAEKGKIKSACLFSGRQACWVSRATRGDWRGIEVAKALGLEDRGETGQRLSFAEQQEAKIERAGERAERMETHAGNARERSEQAFERADLSEGKSGITFGQPILVGHHSERRHRRAIERADNAMRKSIEETDKAEYFERRAEAAAFTASRSEMTDKRYLQNRIDENTAHVRDIARRMARIDCSEEYRAQLVQLKAEYQERLDYFSEAMAALGGVTYSRENVKPGDMVKIRGGWQVVAKANTKTVAASSGVMPWPLKYTWAEVQDHRAAGQSSCLEPAIESEIPQPTNQ